MRLLSNRTVGAAIAMSLLLVLAGCSGGFGSGNGTTAETNGTQPTETAAGNATTNTTAPTTNGTTVANETTGAQNASDSAATGRLLVVLDGRDTHVENASKPNSSFWVDDAQTWHTANESLTLAGALRRVGIDANASSLTYNGTTYRDANNTTVSYRVNSQPVDSPATYEIDDGDQIFVTVYTPNVTTPGRYLSDSHPHPHGHLNITVNGSPINLTKRKYTHADRYFHFHDDEPASYWHAHSTNITLDYAVSTLPGFNVTNDTVTYRNTTYRRNRSGVEVNVTVNGEPVNPETYILKDGDDIRFVVRGPQSNEHSK